MSDNEDQARVCTMNSKDSKAEKMVSDGSDNSASRATAIKEFAARKWNSAISQQSVKPGDGMASQQCDGISSVTSADCKEERETKKEEYDKFQRNVAMAFRLQEAKMVNSKLVHFQKTYVKKTLFQFHFLDEHGNVDREAELKFASEWWALVVYWLTFIFFMVILGFVVVSISDLGATDFLMSRIGSRVCVTMIGATYLCMYPRMKIEKRRRVLSYMIAFYFTALIMTELERLKTITGPKFLNWYSCDDVMFLDCTKKSCQSILPFLTSQCSLVATFLRLPFHHMAFLVLYVVILYLASGFVLQVSLLQENVGMMYEIFCLLMAFGVLVLAARRVEILSRYLFIRSQKENDDCSPRSGPSNPRSPKSEQLVNDDDDAFFAKMIRTCMKGGQVFVGRKSFMKFESLVVFGSGQLNVETISFYDLDMELCFKLGRWEVTKKWCGITYCLIFLALAALTGQDLMNTTHEAFCGAEDELTCSPAGFIKARISPRCVWLVLTFIVMIFSTRKLSHEGNVFQQVSTRLSTVVASIVGYFTVIIMTETVRLASIFQNTLICSKPACLCYAMLSFVTAQFSYMLVMIRLPFHMTMFCLLVVSAVYALSAMLIQQGENGLMYEIACLLLMCFCFTISAHRSDVLARAHFLLEYGGATDDMLAEEVEKRLHEAASKPAASKNTSLG